MPQKAKDIMIRSFSCERLDPCPKALFKENLFPRDRCPVTNISSLTPPVMCGNGTPDYYYKEKRGRDVNERCWPGDTYHASYSAPWQKAAATMRRWDFGRGPSPVSLQVCSTTRTEARQPCLMHL